MSADPLYRRVLGSDFDRLQPRVRHLHDVRASTTWRGAADVKRGSHPIASLLATVFGLPQEGRHVPLSVTFTPNADGSETWDRVFEARRFLSVQRESADGSIAERVGFTTLLLRPLVRDEGLSLELVGARILGIPLPRVLCPQVRTREYDNNGRYSFDVEARLPMIGLLVHYTGTLELTS